MKNKILKSLVLVAGLGTLTSCNDFLDQSSPSSMDGANIYSTYEFAEGTISNIYHEFGEQNYRARSIWYGYNTDVEFYLNSNKADGKADLATYNAGVGNDQMNTTTGTDLWAKMYSAIERANLAIEGLRANADLEDVNMKQLLGEALTLRALFYVDLINMWGDVPARFEPVNTENMYAARSDRDVIYKQIIADLQEAQDLCAWPNEITVTETVERVNKAFVKGFLARVCMQAAGYAQRMDGSNRLSQDPELSKEVLYPIALQACKDVMDKEGVYVALKSNFEDIFNNNGISGDVITAGSESLFEVGYSDDPVRGRIMYTFGLKHNSEDQFTTQKQGSQVGPTPTLFWDYSTKDLRRDVTCCPFQFNKGVQELQAPKSWSFGKLRYYWTNRLIANGNDDGMNWIYMRYADIYLMAAEAVNELDGPQAAAQYLKPILDRALPAEKVDAYMAQATASKDAFREAVIEQRGLEFCGEMLRKADLIRWNRLGSALRATKEELELLRTHSGKYAALPEKIYYQTVETTVKPESLVFDEVVPGETVEIYGLELGQTDEIGASLGYVEEPMTWAGKDTWQDKVNGLFVNDPDTRPYWPIWQIFVDNSNGMLVNYPNYQ